MKNTLIHPTLGEIAYEENFWTGSKKLFVGGEQLQKLGKSSFQLPDGTKVYVGGNFLVGVKATILGGETIQLVPSIKWYEVLLTIIPFVLVLIW